MRGLSSSATSCPTQTSVPDAGTKHVAGSMNFHDLTMVLSGVFAAIACLISGFAFLKHACHFSNPAEQTKILRIISLIPVYALLSFLAASFPNAATYLEIWTDAYESIALASFYLLLVNYVTPVPEMREAFFNKLEKKGKKGKVVAGGSTRWYHHTWIFVFQYVPVSWIVAVATDISLAANTYCEASNSPHFAHIWLTIIESISVGMAFLKVVNVYQRLKPEFKAHKAFTKLLCIKGVIFLSFVQGIIFTILHDTKALEPSTSLSYNDITFGIPNLILCAEMVLFAGLCVYAYDVGPYKLGHSTDLETQRPRGSTYRGGRLGIKAVASALNPMEIIQGLVIAIGYLLGRTPTQQGAYDVEFASLKSDQYLQRSNANNMPPAYPYQQPSNMQRSHSPNRQEVFRERSNSPEDYDERWVRGRQDLDGQYDPLATERF